MIVYVLFTVVHTQTLNRWVNAKKDSEVQACHWAWASMLSRVPVWIELFVYVLRPINSLKKLFTKTFVYGCVHVVHRKEAKGVNVKQNIRLRKLETQCEEIPRYVWWVLDLLSSSQNLIKVILCDSPPQLTLVHYRAFYISSYSRKCQKRGNMSSGDGNVIVETT